MTDISKSFQVDTLSIQNFFQPANIGYFIPTYQRKYSWDEGNVDQLMVDVCYGVSDLLNNPDTSHFLGTLILIDGQSDDRDLQNLNPKALPDQIRKIIDGQQRISTLALLACQIYKRLHAIKQNLPVGPDYNELVVAVSDWQRSLQNVFSFDLRRGNPNRKPIIIRGESDSWIESDATITTYKSEVALYLSQYVSGIMENPASPVFPEIPASEPLGPNLEAMENWLNKVTDAHKSNNEYDFPTAWQIIEKIPQSKLWSYDRPNIVSVINQRSTPVSPLTNQLCSIVQLLAFCHYLLRCCGFTVIIPTSEDRAFDMFQSLNATGTPLTAIETFKPLVTNSADSLPNGYIGSALEDYYDNVDILFGQAASASQKNTLTNEYLTAFALVQDGTKLPSQFSRQRMWLTKSFGACQNMDSREEFVHRMGDFAIYWKDVVKFKPSAQQIILPRTDKLQNLTDAKEALFCVLYLNDAGHIMANTILGRFYGQILRNKPNSDDEFAIACKSIAAFFTLWRAALPNTGLDDVYRKLLASKMSWKLGDTFLTVPNLKDYLKQSLISKGIGTKQDWILKAAQGLRYDVVKTLCKFVLFVVAHDTEPDLTNPGLMKVAVPKTDPHMLPENWLSSDFRSIEHIAPQKRGNNSTWDQNIYLNGDEQRIGNLILLPSEINSTVGNKPWIEKWIYYQYLALTDPGQQQILEQIAVQNGITLSQKRAITLLKEAGHQKHIRSIVGLGQQGQWDRQIIEKRTERICNILWDRMYLWLQ